MSAISAWVIRLTGAAILTGVALAITPSGRVKRVVSLVCGLVMLISLMSVVKDFNSDSFSLSLAKYKQNAADFSQEIENQNDNLNRIIIEERTEAYISDKGVSLEIEELSVSVRAEWSEEGYWYPYSVTISAEATEEQREKLAYYIESELGVSEERQDWSDNE